MKLITLEVVIINGLMTKAFTKKNKIISRTIQIRSNQTLEDLHNTIFEAFDREEEHLYEFRIKDHKSKNKMIKRYLLPMMFDDPFSDDKSAGYVTQTTLGSLNLKVNQSFRYSFDYGDDWQHKIIVIAIDDSVPRKKYPKIIKRVGESPPQYINWEDED